jgi:hypothetical protein
MKTGGRLVKHARYYWLLLAEGHLTRRLFGAIVRRLETLSGASGVVALSPLPTVRPGQGWERCPRNPLRLLPCRVLRVPEGHKRAFDGQRGGGPDGKAG